MSRPDAVAYIKQYADIREVCERYGVAFNSRGQACCPFHDDRHPSASIKNGRFHCWVCDLHLDAIDFVRQISGCDFRTALETLNQLFSLGLDLKKPIPTDEMRRINAERRRKAAELAAYREDYERHHTEFARLWRLTQAATPAPDKPYMGDYAWALGRLEQLNEWFAENRWR